MNIGSVTISAPVTVIVGGSINMQCSVVITPHPLPDGTSTPEFEWFFGQTFDQSLTYTTATCRTSSTYTSTLQLTSVSESDGGMYTCRLRGNHRTAVNTTVTIEPSECLIITIAIYVYKVCWIIMIMYFVCSH